MVISKNTYKIFLSALLVASIPQLSADTNQPDATNTSAIESSITSKDLVLQCRFYAEQLAGSVDFIINLYTSQGERLVKAINPVLSVCETIVQLPEESSKEEIYLAFSLLQQSAAYLDKTLDSAFSQSDELIFDKNIKEQITDQDIVIVFNALNNSLASLMAKVEERFQDLWGTMTMHLRSQLNKLDTILQTIHTNIANNSNIVNKEDLKKEIMDLRKQLRLIQNDMAQASSNPATVMAVYKINKEVVTYLQEAQIHKFRKWSQIDLAEVVRSQGAPNQTLEEMLMRIMETNNDLEQLEKDAEKIDLTLVNKAARFVGDYIINPIERYDLDLVALAATTTLGSAIYATYSFPQTFATSPKSTLRWLFGYPDLCSGKIHEAAAASEKVVTTFAGLGMTKQEFIKRSAEIDPKIVESYVEHCDIAERIDLYTALLNHEQRKIAPGVFPISKLERFIYDHKSGAAAIGLTLFGLATWSYYKIWQNNKNEWSKKVHIWFERLKGGSLAKTSNKYDQILGSSVTFENIIGLEYEKSLVYPHLKYIKDPERWDANELTPPTGILLTGPTRSGKTFFAKAICGELHKQNPDKTIRFISIDAHDIKADGIASWMHVAKVLAPCVLFIDEIDLLGLQRSQDKTLLADFLQALSGIADKDPKKQVIVIGTTNKPENIDTAMLQSGRLALEIRFKYPNMQERKEFIKKRLDKFAIDPEIFEIDIDKLVRETHEKSFEDIKLLIDTAFIHVGIKGSVISQDILEWALDTQLRKIIDIDSKQISDDEKRVLAAHYAGQVLTQYLLNMDEKIAKVTIRQVVVKVKEESVYEQYYSQEKQKGLDQGAIFTYLNHDTLDIKSQEEMAKKAKTLLGARIAERLITHSTSTFFGWKKNSAFNMIKTIVADGIDIKSLSKSGQNALSDETQIKLKEFEQEIEQLLRQHMPALNALTEALQSKQILTIGQITEIINRAEGINNQEIAADEPLNESMIEAIA